MAGALDKVADALQAGFCPAPETIAAESAL